MKVHLLSPYPMAELRFLTRAFRLEGDKVLDAWGEQDITVMYGYRKILVPGKRRILNIHPSYLPYNRGASPNLWSWYDDTPKGVSIIQIDKDVDTGPLLARRLVEMDPDETLETSYWRLRKAAGELFFDMWPRIREGIQGASQMPLTGSSHTIAQSKALLASLPHGYRTPCGLVAELGREYRSTLVTSELVI